MLKLDELKIHSGQKPILPVGSFIKVKSIWNCAQRIYAQESADDDD